MACSNLVLMTLCFVIFNLVSEISKSLFSLHRFILGIKVFEPNLDNIVELKLAASIEGLNFIENGELIPLTELTESSILGLDALFISDLPEDKAQQLSDMCTKNHVELLLLENSSQDKQVIYDVVNYLFDKFYSHEMPNNLDIDDVIDLNRIEYQIRW